jgi:hypothetical protein
MRDALKKFWRPETGIFLGIWFALLVGGRGQLFHDPGTFWHTRVGERILTTGQLVHQDLFSCTFAGQPWIPHQWFGECIMALVHRLDGLDSLLLATVTLLAGLYTWIAHRLIRSGLHWSLTTAVVVLTLAASSSHFHVRPHLITIVLLGWTVAQLVDFEAGRIGLGRLLWLVPVYVLWSNIHGGMLGGLATMILALAGWCLLALLGRPAPIRTVRHAALCGLLILACGLTAFVNPYGVRLPEVWLSIMRSPQLAHIIQEHAPLNVAKTDGIMVVLLGGFYLFVLAGIGLRWPRVSWLLPLPWFVLAWTGIRHAPLFAITAAVALADLLPHTRWAQWMARPGSDLFQFPKEGVTARKPAVNWRPAVLPAALVLLAMGLQRAAVPVPVLGHGWHQIDPSYWPAGDSPDDHMLQTLRRYERNGTPILNELTYGGYLIYYTPGYRVFIDDRCELYGNERQYGRELLLKYDHAMREDPAALEGLAAEFHVAPNFALVRHESPADVYFRRPASGWRLECETESAAFYRRDAAARPGDAQ